MIRANSHDKKRIIEILTKSFNDNKNVNYVIKQDKNRVARIKALMDYTFDYYLRTGEIYLSDDLNGSMVLSFPWKNPSIFISIYLTMRLILKSIGISRVFKVLNWKSEINKYLPKTPFIYLEFIGVIPEKQRNGQGGQLLKKAIERSKELSLPLYLVTSMPENIPFYKMYNIEVYKEITVSHKIFFLKN